MNLYVNRIEAGSRLTLRGPGGAIFHYRANQYMRLTLIGGGTGIAPLVQIARSILDDSRDDTLVKLIWCTRHWSDVSSLLPMLKAMRAFANFSLVLVLSQVQPLRFY